MNLRHKLRKAFRLQTYTGASAVRGLRRSLWLARESPRLAREFLAARRTPQDVRAIVERRRRLRVENLLAAIDPAALARVKAAYADGQRSFWTKYLDAERWLQLNVRYAHELGFVDHPPREVLDLGCGAGYFLFVCKQAGARTLGVDLDFDPIFNDMIRLLGIERVDLRITRQVKLPDFGGRRFDLITAWMICFNDFDRPEAIWGADDWAFLLDDLAERLTPDGRIVFSLNQQLDGRLYTDEIEAVFAARADLMDGKRLLFTKASLDAAAARRRALTAAPAGAGSAAREGAPLTAATPTK